MKGSTMSLQPEKQKNCALLEYVAAAQRITHNQLLEIALMKRISKDRKAFEWRARDLAERGLMKKQKPAFLKGKILYTITRAGINHLEVEGVHMLSLYAQPDGSEENHQLPHSLELNRVHIALMKTDALAQWRPSHHIRILRQFDNASYAKVYDATAALVIDSRVHEIGIEYERSLKRAVKYERILTSLCNKDNVQAVVYLCPSYEILRSLREVFSGFVRKPVLVAEHHQFIANPLDAPLEWQYASTTLRNVLEELRRRENKRDFTGR
jgi:hypothetical protein